MKGSRPLTDDEEKRLFEAYAGRCATRNRCMHEICVTTGLRIAEACSIRVCDVVKNGDVVKALYLERQNAKGKLYGAHFQLQQDALVAIHAQVKYLREHGFVSHNGYLLKSLENQHGGRLSRGAAFRAILAAAALAGIPLYRIGTHSLRKTFARRVAEIELQHIRNGAAIYPYQLVRKMLRHRSLDSTIDYIDVHGELVSSTINALPVRSYDYE